MSSKGAYWQRFSGEGSRALAARNYIRSLNFQKRHHLGNIFHRRPVKTINYYEPIYTSFEHNLDGTCNDECYDSGYACKCPKQSYLYY
jgi:hypothetical protein